MQSGRGRMKTEDIGQLFSGVELDMVQGGDQIRFNGCTIGRVGSQGDIRLTSEMQQRHPTF